MERKTMEREEQLSTSFINPLRTSKHSQQHGGVCVFTVCCFVLNPVSRLWCEQGQSRGRCYRCADGLDSCSLFTVFLSIRHSPVSSIVLLFLFRAFSPHTHALSVLSIVHLSQSNVKALPLYF